MSRTEDSKEPLGREKNPSKKEKEPRTSVTKSHKCELCAAESLCFLSRKTDRDILLLLLCRQLIESLIFSDTQGAKCLHSVSGKSERDG